MVDVQMNRDEFFESYEPVALPKLKKRTYVDYPYLSELVDADFETSKNTLISLECATPCESGKEMGRLQIDRPYFILFIDQFPESQRNLKLWLKMAETVKNQYCVMAFVNLDFQEKLDKNFKLLSQRRFFSHPFFWARWQTAGQMPFALVYRDGWPQGYYNGGFFYQDLLNFIVTTVADPSSDLDKFQKIRPNLMTSLRKKEMELMDDLDKEREKEEQLTERRKLETIDTRNQVIAHAVGFD